MKAQPVLWITDPWDTLDHPKDTTLRLIEESLKLKIPTYWADAGSIVLRNSKVEILAHQVKSVETRTSDGVNLSEGKWAEPTRFSNLHYRPDPPVDAHYIHPLQLLAAAIRGTKSRIVNPPEELLLQSEKFEIHLPRRLNPKNLVSSRWDLLCAFGVSQGKTVLKPLHQAQSKGVELVDWSDSEKLPELKEQLRAITSDFMVPILLQEYMRQIHDGEKRLWFVRGKLLAAVLKRPLKGEFRVQIDQGSPVESTQLNASEQLAAGELGKLLKKRGISLAAIDLIAGKVCDFNITSPGLLVQMEEVTGRNLSRDLLRQIYTNLKR